MASEKKVKSNSSQASQPERTLTKLMFMNKYQLRKLWRNRSSPWSGTTSMAAMSSTDRMDTFNMNCTLPVTIKNLEEWMQKKHILEKVKIVH